MNPPSPNLFFATVNAYQSSAALKAALELELFTAIGGGTSTAAELAERCQASERGVRILADYLTICGFLTKDGARYSLTPDSAAFLDGKSPAYCGGAVEFLLSPEVVDTFDQLAQAVRKGGTATSSEGTIAPEHPVWVKFAKSMAPLMFPAAEMAAELVPLPANRTVRILDIAAGHGVFGIAFAQRNPSAHLVALDWANVLEVAKANAQAAGLSERFSTIAGDAFKVNLGSDYDAVLIPNFLHHTNAAECTKFLRRVHDALRPGGKVVIIEFVPDETRVSPPPAAGFSLIMLSTTPEGDAYTFAEYERMLADAGFQPPAMHPLLPTAQTAVIAAK